METSTTPEVKPEDGALTEKPAEEASSNNATEENSSEVPPSDGAVDASPTAKSTSEETVADAPAPVDEDKETVTEPEKEKEENPERCLKKVAAVINQVDEIEGGDGDELPGEGEDEFFVKYKN